MYRKVCVDGKEETFGMIKFDKVVKDYPNGTHALRGVSFEIEDGEFVFLIGPSGAGKSTVEKLIWREEKATSGTVFVDGKNVNELKNKEIPFLRRKIGIVFQDYRLLPQKTVFENVAFALEIVGSDQKEIEKKVPTALSIVGLSKKADAFPSELSGGEQQRTALARAIVNAPDIIIADEPTGNLDPKNSIEIMKLLRAINNKGTTVIVTTHDKNLVDTMNKRVIEINKGVIIRDESNGGYDNEQ